MLRKLGKEEYQRLAVEKEDAF